MVEGSVSQMYAAGESEFGQGFLPGHSGHWHDLVVRDSRFAPQNAQVKFVFNSHRIPARALSLAPNLERRAAGCNFKINKDLKFNKDVLPELVPWGKPIWNKVGVICVGVGGTYDSNRLSVEAPANCYFKWPLY